MYPSEYCDYIFYTNVYPRSGQIDVSGHSNRSWTVFQEVAAKRSNIEFGVSFSFQIIPLEYLDEAAGSLDALRRRGIRHYGFLTGLYFEADYEYAFMQTRAVIAVRDADSVVSHTMFTGKMTADRLEDVWRDVKPNDDLAHYAFNV
ncbi:uncharacterized protein LOC142768705 [Rhipicephalus microplus]|uniref:uncharacterized protein LOC142768705 n=1 Tax=Rhipicephalus microplus TaxID=6941 RepID=UPI003F6A6A99